MIIRRGDCGQESFELVISKYRKTPWLRNRMLIWVTAINSAAILRYFRTPQECWLREVDAGDLDDGLPRGFLAGAIVEVWVALRLNWACELPLSRGEELP